jgi:hypothetical protein
MTESKLPKPAGIDIRFPYYLYPGFPCSGYFNLTLYNAELVRLYNRIEELTQLCSGRTILHISIGAAMEEYYAEYDANIGDHWRQLYPEYLERLSSVEPETKIYHLIVAPNKTFDPDHFKKPLFMKIDEDWVRAGSSFVNNNITVDIFCTMMPTVDPRNDGLIGKIKDRFRVDMDLDRFGQTAGDIQFVGMFYDKLRRYVDMIKSNGGLSGCYSFAVFNSSTNRSHLVDYVMFPEIKTIGLDLAEWRYHSENYSMLTPTGDVVTYLKSTKIRKPTESTNAKIITESPIQFLIHIFGTDSIEYIVDRLLSGYTFERFQDTLKIDNRWSAAIAKYGIGEMYRLYMTYLVDDEKRIEFEFRDIITINNDLLLIIEPYSVTQNRTILGPIPKPNVISIEKKTGNIRRLSDQ